MSPLRYKEADPLYPPSPLCSHCTDTHLIPACTSKRIETWLLLFLYEYNVQSLQLGQPPSFFRQTGKAQNNLTVCVCACV